MQTAVPTIPRAIARLAVPSRSSGDPARCGETAVYGVGLNMEIPNEVFDAGADENGRHRYGGWWNLCGHIVQKGGTAYSPADGVNVTLAEDGTCVPKWFQPSGLQMRFTVKGKHLKRLGKEYHVEAGSHP